MSKLKALGSEKLTGQDKINRIMEIARFNETLPNPVNEFSKSEYSVDLADNHNYQIVKERQGYIIKRTISESETDYIEPMKNRKYYSSYSQAFKRLNLLAKELNRLNENDEGISLFGEQKKFVLKTPKSAAPSMDTPPSPPAAPPIAPPPVPSPELPDSPLSGTEGPETGLDTASPETDAALDSMAPEGSEDMGMDMGMETPSSMGKEEETVTFRTIQKLTGKLTQKLRVLDSDKGMTSEDIKYVINMVLSALDLSKISDEDREDIMSKFEESETEEMPGMGEELPSDDMTSDTEVEDIQTDMDVPVESEMGENKRIGKIFDGIFAESKVDKVISKYFIQTKKEILENNKKNIEKNFERLRNVNRQMQEVLKLAESVEQEMATRKFLEENVSSNFVGKTNKNNLVLEMKGVQYKVTPKGILL